MILQSLDDYHLLKQSLEMDKNTIKTMQIKMVNYGLKQLLLHKSIPDSLLDISKNKTLVDMVLNYIYNLDSW